MIKLEDKLYTSTEVASILGVSLRSVYRYIEEAKLTAEVKTATGRHRFTKQDILDFLYPEGESADSSREEKKRPAQADYSYAPRNERVEKPTSSFSNSNNFAPKANVPTPEEDAEDVDWLSKFRAAAEKFRQEDTTSDNSMSKDVTPKMDFKPTADLRVVDTPAFGLDKNEESNMFFYRSSLGGLKDIAQTLDKSAKEAALDYAFTLNAGLSLHKPIKPFSLLHAYVRPNDLNYFEKLLSLTPSDSSSAQLCLMTADTDSIFRNRESLHGLSVVAKNQLRKDVESMASDLKDDLYSIL